jgi:hypothetical protein
MSDAIQIGRLRARYRVAGRAAQAKERLDSVLQRVLGGALEAAVAGLGLPESEEICLRALRAPARLSLDATDASVATAWSAALASALREALASGRDVVRFRSLRHALLDLVVSASRGDLSRGWAWAQLGLWEEPVAGTAHLGEALAAALCALPGAAPAAVAEAARRGALPALAARLSERDWERVARAALRAFSASVRSGGESLEAAAPQGDEGPGGPEGSAARSAAAKRCAERIAARSEIAKAVEGVAVEAVARRALAVLATLETEPTALAAGDRAQVVLGALLARERSRAAADPRERIPSTGPERPSATRPPPPPTAGKASRSDRARGSSAAAADRLNPADRASEAITPDAPPDAPIDPRPVGHTRAGGLLYLLHIVGELGLPESLCAEDGPLAARSLRFALHALALALLPIEARDPAALAFCGLGADGVPPSEGAEKLNDLERSTLDSIAAAVRERLQIRLGRELEPARAVLLSTCRRDSLVLADPAWLEARFALEDADVRVRRAGLDLDPGWLPWLGCVVRFIYA